MSGSLWCTHQCCAVWVSGCNVGTAWSDTAVYKMLVQIDGAVIPDISDAK